MVWLKVKLIFRLTLAFTKEEVEEAGVIPDSPDLNGAQEPRDDSTEYCNEESISVAVGAKMMAGT